MPFSWLHMVGPHSSGQYSGRPLFSDHQRIFQNSDQTLQGRTFNLQVFVELVPVGGGSNWKSSRSSEECLEKQISGAEKLMKREIFLLLRQLLKKIGSRFRRRRRRRCRRRCRFSDTEDVRHLNDRKVWITAVSYKDARNLPLMHPEYLSKPMLTYAKLT